jgi:hypothetical protein
MSKLERLKERGGSREDTRSAAGCGTSRDQRDRCGRPRVRRHSPTPFPGHRAFPSSIEHTRRVLRRPPRRVRLVYRPEPVPLAQALQCATEVIEYLLYSGFALNTCDIRVFYVLNHDNPFPLTPPGALRYSPVACRILSAFFPMQASEKICCRVQGRDGSLILSAYLSGSLIGNGVSFRISFRVG